MTAIGPKPAPIPDLALTSIGDLLAEPDAVTPWLVADRIPAGGLTLLAAKPKVGKSTTARDLALAVARGDEWLGHDCRQGLVWYLAFEGRRQDIKHHFRQMGATKRDALAVFVGEAPRDIAARVQRRAMTDRPALIIIEKSASAAAP